MIGRRLRNALVAAALVAAAGLWHPGTLGVRATAPSDNVTYNGSAVITSDSDGPGSDPVPAVDLIGGSGTYAFSSNVCHYASYDGPETGLCSLSLSGTYSTIVCGTGSATASGTLVSAAESGTYNLSIAFTAGFGSITGTFTNADDGTVDNVTGAVQLLPSRQGDDTADCVSGFDAIGHVVGTDP